jgi:flagellar protein FlbD
MIQLSRLNGIPIVLNSDLIKTAESSPDTMITLISGEKLIVRESCEDITERVLEYRARLLTLVARRLPSLKELQPAASLASLDLGVALGGKSPSKPPSGKAEN